MSTSKAVLLTATAAALLLLIPVSTGAQTLVGAGRHTEQLPSDRKARNTPRPDKPGAPVNANVNDNKTPPGVDPRAVRPAQAFPPERIQASPGDPGAGTPDAGLQADPRSQEERKDPGG